MASDSLCAFIEMEKQKSSAHKIDFANIDLSLVSH